MVDIPVDPPGMPVRWRTRLNAHQVRLTGNEANHEDDEPKEADIEAIAAFTETLLKYLFTLPAEVKARKPSTEAPKA